MEPPPAGVRMTWNCWPSSKLEAAKSVLPFAALYTPNRRLPNMPVGAAQRVQHATDRAPKAMTFRAAGAALRAYSLQTVQCDA